MSEREYPEPCSRCERLAKIEMAEFGATSIETVHVPGHCKHYRNMEKAELLERALEKPDTLQGVSSFPRKSET